MDIQMQNQIHSILGKIPGSLPMKDIMNPMFVSLLAMDRVSMSGDATLLIKEEHLNVSVVYCENRSTQNNNKNCRS
jgi:hypothetical protein